MESPEFERLERIARNLPCFPGTLKLMTVQTEYGPVFMAVGKGWASDIKTFGPTSWHGLYAFNYGAVKGICRPMEANGDATEKEAEQSMLNDAVWWMEEFAQRDMNDPSYKLGKQ